MLNIIIRTPLNIEKQEAVAIKERKEDAVNINQILLPASLRCLTALNKRGVDVASSTPHLSAILQQIVFFSSEQ